MKTIKAGPPLIDFIRLCYVAGRPALLVGPHGVGKSELLAQAAAELGIGYICRDLSLMEPPDLVGMPKLEGNKTHFLPPAWLPTDGKGLLVFEELNRCAKDMRGPCLQLLTARTLLDYTLPPGWLPCAAINPSDDDAGYDVAELDPALLSRFVQAGVVADREEWLRWAEARGLHQDVLGYVASDPKIFDDTNPRSWKYTSDLLQAAEKAGSGKGALEAAIAGTVGDKRGIAFRDFRKHGMATLPEAGELLANYRRHRDQVRAWADQGKTDVLDSLTHLVKLLLQPRESFEKIRQDKKTWKALGDFLSDLPPDLADGVREFLRDHHGDVPATSTSRGRRTA
jgi:hypothetical protein